MEDNRCWCGGEEERAMNSSLPSLSFVNPPLRHKSSPSYAINPPVRHKSPLRPNSPNHKASFRNVSVSLQTPEQEEGESRSTRGRFHRCSALNTSLIKPRRADFSWLLKPVSRGFLDLIRISVVQKLTNNNKHILPDKVIFLRIDRETQVIGKYRDKPRKNVAHCSCDRSAGFTGRRGRTRSPHGPSSQERHVALWLPKPCQLQRQRALLWGLCG
ncbi:hypothetical protein FHG87_015621 [Trinorchestia longiramus]|nr:hypothetical protein FHG87_015621 [Trinorchestia longiramus]